MYTNIITIYITISSYQDFVLFTNLVQHITQQNPKIGNFSISIDCRLGFQTEPGIKHWVIKTAIFESGDVVPYRAPDSHSGFFYES